MASPLVELKRNALDLITEYYSIWENMGQFIIPTPVYIPSFKTKNKILMTAKKQSQFRDELKKLLGNELGVCYISEEISKKIGDYYSLGGCSIEVKGYLSPNEIYKKSFSDSKIERYFIFSDVAEVENFKFEFNSIW